MLVLWKDTSHSEAIIWYDKDKQTSLVSGEVAEMTVKVWDDLKDDTYLTQMMWSEIFHGSWPESKDSLETPLDESMLVDWKNILVDTTIHD